jgi:hypothetical protein
MNDNYRVTSELYRLMPPRKHGGSGGLGEALDAADAGRSIREALDAASRTAPATTDDSGPGWPDAPAAPWRQWPARLGHGLARVDVWILIVGIIGMVIAYLALVQPR